MSRPKKHIDTCPMCGTKGVSLKCPDLNAPLDLPAEGPDNTEAVLQMAKRLEELKQEPKQPEGPKKERKQPKGPRLIDPDWLARKLLNRELLTYQPIARWEKEAPSEEQKLALVKRGIDAEMVNTKGHACKLLALFQRRANEGLASFRQVACLADTAHPNPETATFEEALEWISKALGNKTINQG